jgi:16S rRNA (uracil1498-N3)-methyltransferase
MKHHFIDKKSINGDLIKVTGAKFHHLKNVLRIKIGEGVNFFDGDFEYSTQIKEISKKEIIASILNKKPVEKEAPKVFLAAALPKAGKMELVIQKISEVGAAGLIPFFCRNSEVKLKEEKAAAKSRRWQKIAVSAAEQSGRSTMLEIWPPLSFAQLLVKLADFDLILVFWEKADSKLRDILRTQLNRAVSRILLVVGPEGSFTPEEITAFEGQPKTQLVSLGPAVLRAETAGLISVALVLFEIGRLG